MKRHGWMPLARACGAILVAVLTLPVAGAAQGEYREGRDLDRLVARIALYPDPLLAQVLTASTYADDIPDADAWANDHRYLHGDALTAAMTDDSVPWDPSILALLPFPSVLDRMNGDMQWTHDLGDAVLNNRAEVMDAVQRMRARARDYGYLRSSPDVRVVFGVGAITILPVRPGYLCVPTYDPAVVFVAPARRVYRPMVVFGPPIVIATGFMRFGWVGAAFDWRAHSIIIDRRPWERTMVNRATYVHPYERPWVRPQRAVGAEHRVERHEVHHDEHVEHHDEHNDQRHDDHRDDHHDDHHN